MHLLHATAVSVEGRGILILGAAGTGKSGLAMQLMAFGAQLVADDQVSVTPLDGVIHARCPENLRGLIEARGVGILHAPFVDEAPIHLVVDLDTEETERLPPKRIYTLSGIPIALVFGSRGLHFPASFLHYARYGRAE